VGINLPHLMADSAQFVPFVAIDVGLIQNTAQSSYRDFKLLGHNRRVNDLTLRAHKLNVTAFSGSLPRILTIQDGA
jgi:hypothetical protein